MSINTYDDYEKLAKLLYPSIEASGNVYYGQTRKLTMDEVLGKHNLNFESHIESNRVKDEDSDYGYTYDSYFCWKLGPLRESIKIVTEANSSSADTFPEVAKIIVRSKDENNLVKEEIIRHISDTSFINKSTTVYGSAYACYKLNLTSTKIEHNLYSGKYSTYEKETNLVLDCICIVDSGINPTDVTDSLDTNKDRNFFFDSNENLLYIKVCESVINNGNIDTYSHDDSEWGNQLRIVANHGDILLKYSLYSGHQSVYDETRVEYLSTPNDTSWNILQPNTELLIKSGTSKAIKINQSTDLTFPQMSSDGTTIVYADRFNFDGSYTMLDRGTFDEYLPRVQFSMRKADLGSAAYAELRGSAQSSLPSRCPYLFKDCTLLTKVQICDTRSYTVDRNYYRWYRTFEGCSSLKNAVISTERLVKDIFVETYKNCTSLENIKYCIGNNTLSSGASYSESDRLTDNTFQGCPQYGTYTVSKNFTGLVARDHRYLDALELDGDDTYIQSVINMSPSEWRFDNYYLLFVKKGSGTVNISLDSDLSFTDVNEDISTSLFIEYAYPENITNWIDFESSGTLRYVTLTDEHPAVFVEVPNNIAINGTRGPLSKFKFIMTAEAGSDPDICVEAYGDVRSLIGYNSDLLVCFDDYQFNELFLDCTLLTRAPRISGGSSQTFGGMMAFSKMFAGCTNLKNVPDIKVWGLQDSACYNMFSGCSSLTHTTKMSSWFDSYYREENSPAVAANGVFLEMFRDCSSLETADEIIFGNQEFNFTVFQNNKIPAVTYYDTFNNSTSLKLIRTSGISDSEFNNNEFRITNNENYNNCTIVTQQTNIDWYTDCNVPSNWSIAGAGNYNCKLLLPESKYKSGLIIASGSESVRNGRGKVSSKYTESKMLTSKPSVDADAYDTSNGQFNQDIWGIKSFNSPIIFRNGIYGENSCFIAGDIKSLFFQTEKYYIEESTSASDRYGVAYRDSFRNESYPADTGKSSRWVNESSYISLDTASRKSDILNDQLNLSYIEIRSKLNNPSDIHQSLSNDTPYIIDSSTVRTTVYESDDTIDIGYLGDDGDFITTYREVSKVTNYLSSLSASKAYVLVASSLVNNKMMTKIDLSADLININGLLTNLVPSTYATDDSKLKISVGGMVVLGVETSDSNFPDTINFSIKYNYTQSNIDVLTMCKPFNRGEYSDLTAVYNNFEDSYSSILSGNTKIGVASLDGNTLRSLYLSGGEVFQPLSVPFRTNNLYIFLAVRVK